MQRFVAHNAMIKPPRPSISYTAPPCALPSLSEDEIQTIVSSLRNTITIKLASKLYTLFDNTSVPRFVNCKLHLTFTLHLIPCHGSQTEAWSTSRD
ncbi:hypothetical protein F4604DRAFT_1145474 [Suillus subluteus]|nr:hypothetical protein F4604DRAFT_1145474 [Suillus subluteus]